MPRSFAEGRIARPSSTRSPGYSSIISAAAVSALVALSRMNGPSSPLRSEGQGASPEALSVGDDTREANNLELSMSRRGNCHDNAVAESFFSLLKTERIKRKIYKTRSEARAEIFNYIELFYNPSRRHGNNDGVSPIQFEQQYYQKLSSL